MPVRDAHLKTRAAFLQTSPLFDDLHGEELALLAELCVEVPFEDGMCIFEENQPGDCLFVVESGEVELGFRGIQDGLPVFVIARLTRGEFFGEMSMLERRTRSASAVACGPTRLLMLTTEDIYSFARIYRNGFSVVVINIARTLSRRLRLTNLRLRQAL